MPKRKTSVVLSEYDTSLSRPRSSKAKPADEQSLPRLPKVVLRAGTRARADLARKSNTPARSCPDRDPDAVILKSVESDKFDLELSPSEGRAVRKTLPPLRFRSQEDVFDNTPKRWELLPHK